MAFSQSSKLERYKYYLKILFKIHKVKCHFCNKLLDENEFFPKKSSRKNSHIIDPFMVHHINGDHYDDRPENWAFAHRTCHGKYNWEIKKKEEERILNKILERIENNETK